MSKYSYVIVGGGMAAHTAIQGIREHDPDGDILVIGRKRFAPYQRSPLSKVLWRSIRIAEYIPYE